MLALVPAGVAAAVALASGDPLRAVGALVLMTVDIVLIIAMGMLTLLVTAGRAGLRPTLVVPVALVAAVVAPPWWVTSTGVVIAAPASSQSSTSSAAAASAPALAVG